MAYQNYSGAWLPDTNQWGVRYIKGGAAGETLQGSDGADEFEGGGGRDTFVGRGGDDYYWLRDNKDLVIEAPNSGVDTVRIWSSYTLPSNVENLIVFGDGSFAAGNELNNVIQGLDGAQILYGGKGQDVLAGGGGADTFVVVKGEGAKVIQDFQPGADQVRLIGSSLTSFAAVQAHLTQRGADVILDDGGNMLALRNVSVGQLNARDFQLPIDIQSLGQPLFNEDFNSLKLANPNNPSAGGWRPHNGFQGETGLGSFTLARNGEQQVYVNPAFQGTSGAPLGLNPFSVNNGVLTIRAEKHPELASQMWGYNYTSGMLTTEFSHAQKYGYFEMRADLPEGQGLWPAFWLWPQANSQNELDILEAIGSEPNTVYNAYHSAWGGDVGRSTYVPNAQGFHTYGLLWDAQNLTYYIDGAEVWRTATPGDMNQSMYMIVNLAVGGNWPGSPDGSTAWPAEMKIDYVRAYGLPGAGAPPVTTPPVTTPGGGDQVLTSPYPGATLQGGAGADTLKASQGADTLSGGAGADTFVFKAMPWSAGKITDFVPGVDKLDISALYTNGYKGTDPVADGYVSFVSDGAGGAKVLLDVDGPSGPNALKFQVVILQGASPSGLTAAAVFGGGTPSGGAGQTLTAPYPGATLQGGAGADTLSASQGSDTLSGGAGADTFVFKAMPWSAGKITDFTPGADKLDLRALATAAGEISFVSDGAGGSKVMLDVDGSGGQWPFHVTTLVGIRPDQITAGDWMFH